MANESRRLFDQRPAAVYLGLSDWTIRDYVLQGLLPVVALPPLKSSGPCPSQGIPGEACVAALTRYDWPGNVRELQNVLAALAVRGPKRDVIPATALPPIFGLEEWCEVQRLGTARRLLEERFVRQALARSAGHRGRAARELGVTRQGLTKLLARLGISG